MTSGFVADGRSILAIGGADHRKFLQDLVTNDVSRLAPGSPVYAALLTPQGKYLADFFLIEDGGRVLLDVASGLAQDLARRLMMYRLRAAVTIEDSGWQVAVGFGDAPEGAVRDPRDPGLGWRLYGPAPLSLPETVAPLEARAYAARRIQLGIPETGIELIANDSYILEAGFDRLHGVDFRKGCYVGQEVTARMRHKTELRKGLRRVAITGTPPPPGTPILRDGKTVGTLHSATEGQGLAHLRFDRIAEGMTAGDAAISVLVD